MASAVVRAPAALSELARIGDDVRCGAVRPRDVRRTVEHAPAAVTASRARLLDVLARAGRLAAAVRAANGGKGTRQELREQQTARRRLAVEIASLRLRQSVLDQVAAAMGVDDGGAAARLAFARARGASRRAKSEWTAASAYLVLAIAKRYRRPGVDTVNLVQDGSIGLIRAVEKFDASLGYRFHAYAAWWIRQHIFRALADYGRSIRVPMPMVEASQRVGRVRRVFEGVHGREPSDAEIAAVSGLDVGTVAAVDAIIDEPMSLQGRIGDQELDLSIDSPTGPPPYRTSRSPRRASRIASMASSTSSRRARRTSCASVMASKGTRTTRSRRPRRSCVSLGSAPDGSKSERSRSSGHGPRGAACAAISLPEGEPSRSRPRQVLQRSGRWSRSSPSSFWVSCSACATRPTPITSSRSRRS